MTKRRSHDEHVTTYSALLLGIHKTIEIGASDTAVCELHAFHIACLRMAIIGLATSRHDLVKILKETLSSVQCDLDITPQHPENSES